MPTPKDLTNIWKNVKEFELAPIQKEALQEIKIILAGNPGSGRHTLAGQLRNDPVRPDQQLQSPLLILDLPEARQPARVDLLVLLVDATSSSFEAEQATARHWSNAGVKVIVFINKLDLLNDQAGLAIALPWNAAQVVYGSAKDVHFLLEKFVPAILSLLSDRQLALGRQFPLFRVTIARQLISETSFSNAAYALSTGVAEAIPVLDLPLNITDMIILTKAQAFLVYRLGLLLGYSTRWQDYISEFGSVIGGGFLWRQLARQLVGLIPIWGIIPKVAVSYAGTYVVGHSVLQWYLTGRHLSRSQLNALYKQALLQGKQQAQKMAERLPKLNKPQLRLLPTKRQSVLSTGTKKKKRPGKCPACGKTNAKDAVYCQYCGQRLGESLAIPPEQDIPLE